jgi:hypothetical protein
LKIWRGKKRAITPNWVIGFTSKLQGMSKTVNNIRNLTWVKMISTGRSNYPEILKKI